MLKPKVVYQERCAVEAESKEGKRYTREISLIAKELWRKDIDSTDVIFLEVEFKNGQKEEKEAMFTSSLKVVRDYFLKKITAAIDLVHPEKRIKIVFPQAAPPKSPLLEPLIRGNKRSIILTPVSSTS